MDKKILIADTDVQSKDLLCSVLEQEGFSVETARSSEEVIWRVQSGGVGILIVDIGLLGPDGREALAIIKNLDRALPVIVTSSEASMETLNRIRDEGIFFHCVKPLDIEEVKSAVRDAAKQLRQRHARAYLSSVDRGFVRAVRTTNRNGENVAVVPIGAILPDDSETYRNLISRLKEACMPIHVEIGKPISAKGFVDYLERNDKVILLVSQVARAQGTGLTEGASEGEITIPEVGFPEVLHWVNAMGVNPEVKISGLDSDRIFDEIVIPARPRAKKRREEAKVLIVDDDPDFVEATRAILRSGSYDVDAAYDKEEAMETIESKRPDLILLDVVMQGPYDGLKMCHKLKQDPKYRSIPVIMITAFMRRAREGFSSRIRFASVNADDYMEKPLQSEELLKRIGKLLQNN